ncbi:MAG: hypothetical protein K5757_07885 [Bacteroidaceae bacterium]|nr:hypothetical protein [Bacteroidaceae bacterium]
MKKLIFYTLLILFTSSLSSCSNEDDDDYNQDNIVLYEIYSQDPNQKIRISFSRDGGSIITTGRWESAVRTDKSECYVFADNYYEGLSPITDERPYVYAKVYVNGKLRTMTQSKSGVNFYVALKKSSSYWNQQKDSFLDLKGKSFTK